MMSAVLNRIAGLLGEDPVVVTGVGAVSAAGAGVEGLWEGVAGRRSFADWVDLVQPGGAGRRVRGCAVPVGDWSGEGWWKMGRRLDRGAQYGLLAAVEAGRMAGLEGAVDGGRLGVICGTSRGPKQKWEEAHGMLGAGRRVKATMAATTTLGASVGALCQVLSARGPSWLVSTACASGAHAIGAAAEQLLLGQADVMVAGGADDAMNAVVYAGLEAAGVLAEVDGGCRPFGAGRTGMVPGSGAGMLVLELLSHARRRGARPLARLGGWCLGMDPQGLAGMHPQGAGLQRTMRGALAMAGLSPGQIGYVNAHATGTVANDAAEGAAILAVFGEGGPLVSGSKGVTGHCLGATPALEAVLCVEALRRGVLPPAFPDTDLDPAFAGLRFSTGGPAPGLRHVLSNSAAFWGFQGSLVFSAVTDV